MSKKLYVGNLRDDTTEDDLRELFSVYGMVISVVIKRDSVTGVPWGYGFVVMETNEAANAAVKSANGQMMRERRIKVDEMVTY